MTSLFLSSSENHLPNDLAASGIPGIAQVSRPAPKRRRKKSSGNGGSGGSSRRSGGGGRSGSGYSGDFASANSSKITLKSEAEDYGRVAARLGWGRLSIVEAVDPSVLAIAFDAYEKRMISLYGAPF